MRSLRAASLVLLLVIPSLAVAQSRGQRDGRDSRDSDRSGRYDRSERGERGRAPEGTDRSSGSRWGGGGGFGSPFGGGGGGAFFGGGMADMIRRFDRNGNNMIDPDEVAGPAGFFLQRMAQNNPKIDLSKPIPIDVIVGEVEKFRGGMMGGAGPGGEEDDGMSSGSNEPQPLVPDFRLASELPAVEGFGVASSVSNLKVTDRDRADAAERMRRYDRNRDGFLTPDELAQGRWAGDPMQFDKNRDGKLSIEELAVRQADRRLQQQASASNSGSNQPQGGPRPGEWGSGIPGGWSRGSDPTAQGGNRSSGNAGGSSESASRDEERFGDAKSYRVSQAVADTTNLPSFFLSSDANGDNQVTLKEFAETITDQKLEEFRKWDLNGDGVITAREALAVARSSNVSPQNSSSSGSAIARSRTSSADAPRSEPSIRQNAAPNTDTKSGGGADADMEWARRQIAKYDKDGDGMLSKDEWEKMIVKPAGADYDRDGKITAEEYAKYRASK